MGYAPGPATAHSLALNPSGKAEHGACLVNSAAMEDNFDQTRHHQLALTRAFEIASEELGIGRGSLDVWKSERLGQILGCLAREGDWDPSRLARKAVAAFRIQSAPDLPANAGGTCIPGMQSR
jgi:hypothetical protein